MLQGEYVSLGHLLGRLVVISHHGKGAMLLGASIIRSIFVINVVLLSGYWRNEVSAAFVMCLFEHLGGATDNTNPALIEEHDLV